MSGRRPRKVVLLVDCAGRGRAAASRSGGSECSTTLRVFDLVSCGDEVSLDVGRRRIGHHFWRMGLPKQSSSPLLERPGFAPPIADAASSLRQWWEIV
jgi:hypothetical protein